METSKAELELNAARIAFQATLADAVDAARRTTEHTEATIARLRRVDEISSRLKVLLSRVDFTPPPLPMIGASAEARERLRVPAGPHYVYDPLVQPVTNALFRPKDFLPTDPE
jgi:hypothetical protein